MAIESFGFCCSHIKNIPHPKMTLELIGTSLYLHRTAQEKTSPLVSHWPAASRVSSRTFCIIISLFSTRCHAKCQRPVTSSYHVCTVCTELSRTWSSVSNMNFVPLINAPDFKINCKTFPLFTVFSSKVCRFVFLTSETFLWDTPKNDMFKIVPHKVETFKTLVWIYAAGSFVMTVRREYFLATVVGTKTRGCILLLMKQKFCKKSSEKRIGNGDETFVLGFYYTYRRETWIVFFPHNISIRRTSIAFVCYRTAMTIFIHFRLKYNQVTWSIAQIKLKNNLGGLPFRFNASFGFQSRL